MLNCIKNLPVVDRFGAGGFTYTFYCENKVTNEQAKYEVFANSFEMALGNVSVYFNSPFSYNILNNNEADVCLGAYPNLNCKMYFN